MTARLKGQALRDHVRTHEARIGFPRWRARVAAQETAPVRSLIRRAYDNQREKGLPAGIALWEARDALARRAMFFGPNDSALDAQAVAA